MDFIYFDATNKYAYVDKALEMMKILHELNEQGYVITDRNLKTSVDGLYAAGDVCVKQLRQVVTAVADGAIAATELEKYAAALHAKTGLVPAKPAPAPAKKAPLPNTEAPSALFDSAMLRQLHTVFDRMAGKLVLKLSLDDRPVSGELKQYMRELTSLTDKLSMEIVEDDSDKPCVKVCRSDGSFTGLAFHGVPGGHEFTSFVLGLYNAAGPGQPVDSDLRASIAALPETHMKVLVSLSCTMCPELVTAAQRIAAENPKITAEVYDLTHFPALRDKYNVMSVPCLVLNDGEKITFGKKNLRQLVDILKK